MCFPKSLPSFPNLSEIKELFKDAGLEHYWEQASVWCIEEGARFVDEIRENKDEFAEALSLKRFEKNRLEKTLARAAAVKPASPVPEPQFALPARLFGEHAVRVRNTFFEHDDCQRIDFPRSNTAPAGQEHRDNSDSEEVDTAQPGSPRGVADLALYKTKTVVDYEAISAWGWLGSRGDIQGDPNLPCADERQAESEEPGAAVYAVVVVPAVEVNPDIRWTYEPIMGPAPIADLAPRPERDVVIQRTFSALSSVYRIRWTVDSRRLKSFDREAASPTFELSFAGPVEFKLILKPRAVHEARGGASFKQAQGWGSIDLRCLSDVKDLINPVVTFRLGVGSHSNPKKQQRYRGPVRHDFRDRPICGLEGREEWWDFQRSVDKQTRTFVVCLEVFPSTG